MYVDALVESLRREMDQRQLAYTRALDLAREELSGRLAGVGQFREQLGRERDQYVRWDTLRWIVGTLFFGFLGLAVSIGLLWLQRGPAFRY